MTEARAWQLYRDHEDLKARDWLVAKYTPLAMSLIPGVRAPDILASYDDLASEALVALVRTIDLYDPSKGYAFSTFASHWISGKLKNYTRTLGLNRRNEDRDRIRREQARVKEVTGSDCTQEQACVSLGWGNDRANRALGGPVYPMTFSQLEREHDKEWLLQQLPRWDGGLSCIEEEETVEEMLRWSGSARAAEFIRLKHEYEMTLEEIGRRYGLSPITVSRIVRQGLENIRAVIAGQPVPDRLGTGCGRERIAELSQMKWRRTQVGPLLPRAYTVWMCDVEARDRLSKQAKAALHLIFDKGYCFHQVQQELGIPGTCVSSAIWFGLRRLLAGSKVVVTGDMESQLSCSA